MSCWKIAREVAVLQYWATWLMNIFNSQDHMLLSSVEQGVKRSFLNNTQCGSYYQAQREEAQSWMCSHNQRRERSLTLKETISWYGSNKYWRIRTCFCVLFSSLLLCLICFTNQLRKMLYPRSAFKLNHAPFLHPSFSHHSQDGRVPRRCCPQSRQ